MSLSWQNIVLDCPIASTGSIQTKLGQGVGVRYNLLLHQAVQQKWTWTQPVSRIEMVWDTENTTVSCM